ncbi:hypothetical protein, partial [Halovivax sp.]|uniref:hypothetical protein n=1 Tax=Halovivax sp. TaxID=1935978 RepID=UPI0025C26B81
MPYETDIEVQNQTARITIPIPGTDRSLAYASRRVEGYLPPRSITVPVTDEEFDPDDDLLKRVESTVLVEGNGYTATWSGDEIETGLNHEFTWDATDTYGRGIQGGAHVTGEIAHVYEGMHGSSNEVADRVSSGDSGGSGPTRVTGGTFDYPSSVSLDGGRNDTTFRLVNNWDMELYRYDAGVHGLGGWTVDAHHMLFDELRPTIEYGDGTKRSLGAGISETIETAELRESNPRGIATGSDGTVYAGSGSWVMKASAESLDESRGGFITLDEIELSEDSPVTFEDAGVFRDIAIGPDDEIYATDFNNEYVYKISTDGMMTVVAGTGDSAPDPGSGGREYHADIEGSLATEMDLLNPGWIDVGPEGDIYFVHGDTPRDDSVYRYIIRIRTNGRVALVNHYGSGGTDTEYLENAP